MTLRHIGIPVGLTVKLAVARDFAVDHHPGQDGFADSFNIGRRQDAGIAQADRADMGIWGAAKLVWAGAEHLCFGMDLHMDFQAEPQSKAWEKTDARLRAHIQKVRRKLLKALDDPAITSDENRKKILTSLDNHWHELTLFLDHLSLPMHNNDVERGYRWLAIFRRISFACNNESRAHDRARFYTIFQTLQLHSINSVTFLTEYLQERARHKLAGTTMPLNEWMPWDLSDRVKGILGVCDNELSQ